MQRNLAGFLGFSEKILQLHFFGCRLFPLFEILDCTLGNHRLQPSRLIFCQQPFPLKTGEVARIQIPKSHIAAIHRTAADITGNYHRNHRNPKQDQQLNNYLDQIGLVLHINIPVVNVLRIKE